MSDQKISVITCTYNSERYIEENLKSVWSTKKHPYEQLIIDGYSHDKTVQIVKKYQKKGYNIRIIQSKPKGISDAFNTGIKNSKGNIIQILNSDDYIVDKNIFSVVENEFRSGVTWLYGRIISIDSQGKKISNHPNILYSLFSKQLTPFLCVYPHQSTFMAKSLFEKFGLFDVKIKSNMDWDYWIRIGNKLKPKQVSAVFIAFRIHTNSTSFKNAFNRDNLEERIYMLKKYYKGLPLYLLIMIMFILNWPVYWVYIHLFLRRQ